jgi:hypothetical protein
MARLQGYLKGTPKVIDKDNLKYIITDLNYNTIIKIMTVMLK